MELKFNLDGNVAPLVGWLTMFAKIRNSLLLEIDPVNKAFVAKTFDKDGTNARYSSIRFADCGITMPDGFTGDYRIRFGLTNRLKSFIHLIEYVGASTDESGNSHMSISFTYEPVEFVSNHNAVSCYAVRDAKLKNSRMSMKMIGSRVNDYIYLSDNTFFDTVFHVDQPVTFTITSDEIKMIMDTAEIYAPEKDAETSDVDDLNFAVKDGKVSIENTPQTDGIGQFSIKLADIEDETTDMTISVDRINFSGIVGKGKDDYQISIGFGDMKPKVLMKSLNADTYIVIAGIIDTEND